MTNCTHDLFYKHLARKKAAKLDEMMELVTDAYAELGIAEGKVQRLTAPSVCGPHAQSTTVVQCVTDISCIA